MDALTEEASQRKWRTITGTAEGLVTAQTIEHSNCKGRSSQTLLGHVHNLNFAITLGSWTVPKEK